MAQAQLAKNEQRKRDRRYVFRKFKEQRTLQILALICMAYMFVFNYIPMLGITMAFNNFSPKNGLLGFFTSKWVGFRWFHELFTDKAFWPLLVNTVSLSALRLLFTFPTPILFALALNEVGNMGVKRVVQTVSYLPHFISWVVTQGILISFLNIQNGVFQQWMLKFGWTQEAVPVMSNAKYFWGLLIVTDIWKETGWSAIIFLAAITGVDPTLYEAAVVDGASRMRRIWHITLPSIKGTISIMLIMSLGSLIGNGLFEPCYLLYNTLNASKSEVLQTYILKVGVTNGRYSFGQAASLFQSVIAITLVMISNQVSKWISGIGLF
jgi:putative aldouronate transport system permease protein